MSINVSVICISTFNKFNDGARSLREAVIKTGEDRLRPVLLTTGTTVLGLVPTATQFNVDFFNRTVSIGDPATEWWAYMSQAIIYGLLFATALTLIVTPCMLMARESFAVWRDDKFSTLRRLLTRKGFHETEVIPPLPAE